MHTQEELKFELLAIAIRARNDKIIIEELEERLKAFESKEPYGTVIRDCNDTYTFYPWAEELPCFFNVVERKIVYLA